MYKITRIALMLTLIMVIVPFVKGQSPGGPGTPTGSAIPADGGSPSTSVPFDGGLSIILLASGIGYGARKLMKSNQVNRD